MEEKDHIVLKGMLNDLSGCEIRHCHHHLNIPPSGPCSDCYSGNPYSGNPGPFYPTYPGSSGAAGIGGRSSSRQYPPFRPDFEHRHMGEDHHRMSGPHYGPGLHGPGPHGPGPHGPGRWNPQSGYGWHPPAHCVGNYSWCEGRNGSVPYNAVKVGVDKDGGHIFAGRAYYEGDLLPAKVIPSHNCAFVPWGGTEHQRHEYEVLCSTHVGWTTCSRGDVPPEAICVGQTSNGERLYMGRVMHEGTLTPGKVQPSHGVLYIPYAGMEISYTEYEVMVLM